MKIMILTGLSCLTSAGCLLVGYCLAELWFIYWALLGMIILWISFRKKTGRWLISIILVMFIVLAVIGLLLGLSPYLMMVGCTSALALWDLVLFKQDTACNPRQPMDMLLEKLHIQALAAATGMGLLFSMLSLIIHLHLPFGLIAGLVLLAAYGLYRAFKYLLKQNNRNQDI